MFFLKWLDLNKYRLLINSERLATPQTRPNQAGFLLPEKSVILLIILAAFTMSSTIIPILQLKLALERKSHESKSPEQARLMQAVAHNPDFAKKVDIPQEVGQEFVDADKTAHEQDGGNPIDISKNWKNADKNIGNGWVAFPCNDLSYDEDDGGFYWYVCPKDYYEQTGKIEDGHAFDGVKLKGLEEVADHVLYANNGDDGVDSLKKYGFEIIGYPEEIIGKEKAFKPIKKTNHSQPEPPQQAERPDPIHFELNGLPISIENQAGTVRSGIDSDGHEWAIQLQDHYGEIRETEGADGDYVDCFINPDYDNFNNDLVFVINQNNPHTGEFDEVKVMLGYNSLEDAEVAYLRNYEDGWQGLGEIHETNYPEFKEWLNSNNTTEEFEDDNTAARY